MTGKTYEDGLTEGRIMALENTAADHSKRLDHHSGRLRILEKVVWIGGGIAFAIQSFPLWQDVVRKFAGLE